MVDSITKVQKTGQAQVLAASDLACAAAVGAGVGGVTSTNVWVFPDAFLDLADPDVPPARKAEILTALRHYADLVRRLGQPSVVKAAMVARGYAGTGNVRAPYVPLEGENMELLSRALLDVDDRLAAIEG